MKTFFKSAVLAVSLAAAGLAATAPAASAASASFSVVIAGNNGVYVGHANRYGYVCAPGLALKKARHLGIRNARIVDADRRTVKVRGFRNGFRSGAVFANDRGCPVIARL
ncbi:hypothetical protein E2A64_16725 [Pseudohoeflea suaedae]|uniref:Antifreeze protein n=1 Tax=Pseudohoeflea suaedae TaxID=877384 RepID=A0A4R5PHK9_9HYPH|nr:hypothetical protein [Pseudohoeflea suaedae]TDH34313.1 hypothetical protein E2A64_16725 [Pseudohoeflea suaedae]